MWNNLCWLQVAQACSSKAGCSLFRLAQPDSSYDSLLVVHNTLNVTQLLQDGIALDSYSANSFMKECMVITALTVTANAVVVERCHSVKTCYTGQQHCMNVPL